VNILNKTIVALFFILLDILSLHAHIIIVTTTTKDIMRIVPSNYQCWSWTVVVMLVWQGVMVVSSSSATTTTTTTMDAAETAVSDGWKNEEWKLMIAKR
jgi:hypothetical protein